MSTPSIPTIGLARFICIALLLGSCAAQNDDDDPSGSGGSGNGGDDDDLLSRFTSISADTTDPTATPTGGGCPDAPNTGFAVLDLDAVQLDADHVQPPLRNATCPELKLHGGCEHPAHGERIRKRCASTCGFNPVACWTEPIMPTVDDADSGPTGLAMGGFFEALADDEIVWLAVVAALGLGSLVATVLVVRAKRRGGG